MNRSSVTALLPISTRTQNVREIVAMLREALAPLDRPTSILLIVDGDLPQKLEEARSIASAEGVEMIALARNFGEGGALRTGLSDTDAEIVVTHPAYFQVKPDVIARLIDSVDAGADLAFASRRPGKESTFTRFQRWFFNALMRRAMWVGFKDISCGVRAGRRESLLELAHTDSFHRFLPVQAAVRGFDVREIDAEVHENSPRTRIYSPGTYLRRFLDIINVFFLTRFLHKPMRFFGLVGSGILGLGAGVCLYLTIVRFFFNEAIGQRPALLMGVLMIAVGIQLLALGLLGELVAFSNARESKPYRIREVVRLPAASDDPATPSDATVQRRDAATVRDSSS